MSAAASIFIVSSVKVPAETTALITSEMNHQLPDQRINAVYRFQALWKNRHQVWQRLEENGQIAMKVVPSQIEFTLPSPKLGIETMAVVDAPWEPKLRTTVSLAVHDRGQQVGEKMKRRKFKVLSLKQPPLCGIIQASSRHLGRQLENSSYPPPLPRDGRAGRQLGRRQGRISWADGAGLRNGTAAGRDGGGICK